MTMKKAQERNRIGMTAADQTLSPPANSDRSAGGSSSRARNLGHARREDILAARRIARESAKLKLRRISTRT